MSTWAKPTLLDVQGIDVYYGDLQVLWGVSFRVASGELVTLIGANGAGKTTTLKTILGLLRPRRGQIRFNGASIDRMPPHAVVEAGIVYVPEGRGIFPQMTAEENLLMGAYSRRARGQRRATLARVYELFPVLAERRQQLAGTLSGGEMQMLALGRALMAQPTLLMLDEPSQGLAPQVVEAIFAAITAIKQSGATVLLVEQDAGRALRLCDRAYVLETGRVTLEGTGAELLRNDYVREAYLGL